MTDTIRFVNTASAGGDGTGGIDVVAGGTAAYTSMSAAEAAEQTTVNVGDRFIFECKGTTADTTFTFAGWTIDGRVIVRSHTSSRHAGVFDATKYRVEDVVDVVNLDDNNITVEFIQIKSTTSNTRDLLNLNLSSGAEILRNIFVPFSDGGDRAISVNSSSQTALIAFNIFDSLFSVITDISGNGGILELFNNTFINGTDIYTAIKTNTPLFTNNLFQGSTNGITGTVDSLSDFNSTDSANFGSGYTTNTNDRVNQTFTFVNAGANDYHLTSGDTGALDFGTDLSGVTDSIDIDGDAITGTWSIGADFIVSVGAGDLLLTNRSIANFSGMRQ